MSASSRFAFGQAGSGQPVFHPQTLLDSGPRMPCEVRVDAAKAESAVETGIEVPIAVLGEVLIDTGAARSCVDRGVLAALGIDPIAHCEVLTAQGEAIQGLYTCGMAFPGTSLPSLDEMFVIGSELERHGVVALLGRDVLAGSVFVYNGHVGGWTLAI